MEIDKQVKRKLNWPVIITVIVVLVLLAVFVIRPSIIGYTVYQEILKSNSNVNEYGVSLQQTNSELAATKTNLSVQSQRAVELQQILQETQREVKICDAEKNKLDTTLLTTKQSLQDTTKTLQQELLDKDADVKKQLLDKDTQVKQQLNQKDQETTSLLSEKDHELEQAKNDCDNKTVDVKNELSTLHKNWDELVQNTARNICCKQKVDNPNINYYEVVNNKITCQEAGENKLNCFS